MLIETKSWLGVYLLNYSDEYKGMGMDLGVWVATYERNEYILRSDEGSME